MLRSFREGHPGVTGHAAHWAYDSDMRTAPVRPGTRSRCPITTSRTLATPSNLYGATTGPPLMLCSLSPVSRGPEPVPHVRCRGPELVPHTLGRGLESAPHPLCRGPESVPHPLCRGPGLKDSGQSPKQLRCHIGCHVKGPHQTMPSLVAAQPTGQASPNPGGTRPATVRTTGAGVPPARRDPSPVPGLPGDPARSGPDRTR